MRSSRSGILFVKPYFVRWESNAKRCQQAEWVAMRTKHELWLHPAPAEENQPKALVELAQATGADPTLLRTSPESLNRTAAPFDQD